MLLLREKIEMFSNMFWIRGERSVYINIRGEVSVIQVSLKRGKFNLLMYVCLCGEENWFRVNWLCKIDYG